MGGSASLEMQWLPDQDSVTLPGEKCIMSTEIKGHSPEEIWAIVKKFITDSAGQKDSQYIVKREFKDLSDGGKHEEVHIEVTGLANIVVGSIKMTTHTVYYLDDERRCAVTKAFFADETLKKPVLVSTLTLLKDPFRLELFSDTFARRDAGPLLRNAAQRLLSLTGYDMELQDNQQSPADAGEKSVLSPEVDDPELTTELLWEKLKAALVDHMSGAELPDGSVVTEEGWIIIDQSSVHKYFFDKDRGLIVDHNYMDDEEMAQVQITAYLRVLQSPTRRVEAWTIGKTARHTDAKACENAKKWFDGMLKMAAQEKENEKKG